MKELPIQFMSKDDIRTAIKWAEQEGWNPGLSDAELYATLGSQSFLKSENNGEIVAMISAVRYGTTFAFVGFYIAKPEYRGQGFGLQIWNAAMQQLQGCNIALDGVLEQVANYQKSGFKLAYRNQRYQFYSRLTKQQHDNIVTIPKVPMQLLLDYCQPFFPADRSKFMQHWFEQKHGQTIVYYKDNQIFGVGTIRQCGKGFKIGPLFADDVAIADTILRSLISDIDPKEPIFIDFPEVNRDSVLLKQNYNMELDFETARMYTKEEPDIAVMRTFGNTSFEVG